jgi:hypothetical protein
MKTSSSKERPTLSLIAVASMFVVAAVASTGSQARVRHTTMMKTGTVPQQQPIKQQPIKLRYYGGPKSPMYPG